MLSAVPGVALLWLGFPFAVAGAGVALGLEGRRGARRKLALVAVVLGCAVLGVGLAAYLVASLTGS